MPYIRGIAQASLEELKSFCASLATYGGAALFHMAGDHPRGRASTPRQMEHLRIDDRPRSRPRLLQLDDAGEAEVDFVSLGCPHLSIDEIARLAELLQGKTVRQRVLDHHRPAQPSRWPTGWATPR